MAMYSKKIRKKITLQDVRHHDLELRIGDLSKVGEAEGHSEDWGVLALPGTFCFSRTHATPNTSVQLFSFSSELNA